MIKYGSLNNLSVKQNVSEEVNTVLEFLKNTTEELTESTKIAPGIIINPVSLMTKPEQDCLFEAHKQLYDIHIIISGEERICVSSVDDLAVVTEYEPLKDIMFLDGAAEKEYILKSGDWLVCLPEDAHKVGMAPNNACIPVKKLVAKIKVKK